MIEAQRLGKRFGTHTVLDDVSFVVERGEIVGFLGPNGAGKTTTLRILAGVFPPTTGRASIDGCDLVAAPRTARSRLGYAPERPALHLEMTVAGQLEFVAAMRGASRSAARRAAAAAMARLDLEELRTRRLETLSRGLRQRVGLAIALVGNPPAVLLDEPAAGLDPAQSAELRRLVRVLGREHAVLVSSHVLADMEVLCDRVIILHHGRILAAGPPAAIAARLRPAHHVLVEAGVPGAALEATLAGVDGVRRVEVILDDPARSRCRVEGESTHDIRPALAAAVVSRGWRLLALSTLEPTLEEAFLAVTAPRAAPP